MSDAIEAYELSTEQESELAANRQRMIETVLAQFDNSGDVDAMTDDNSKIEAAA